MKLLQALQRAQPSVLCHSLGVHHWARMTCRHAVEHISEAPVLHPLKPLHEFLEKLGRPPDRDALTIYIARLREMVRRAVQSLCLLHAA